jgi:hypothetical protein
MAFKKVSGFQEEQKPIKEFWKPQKVGETLEGILRRVVPNRGKYRNRNMYVFENEDGEIIAVMGTTILDKVLPKYVGKKVKIEYVGRGINKNQVEYQLFDIYVDEDEEFSSLDLDY